MFFTERPLVYKRSASPWGHTMLPHLVSLLYKIKMNYFLSSILVIFILFFFFFQLMSPSANSSTGGSQKDFTNELRNAIRNANANIDV